MSALACRGSRSGGSSNATPCFAARTGESEETVEREWEDDMGRLKTRLTAMNLYHS